MAVITVKKALSVLKARGYKFTDKREWLLHILTRENRYLSAKDVLDLMQLDYPQLSADTVYRNLTLLHELGIVEAIDLGGERLYRMSCEGDDHHHHLVCTECGKAKKIEACPMETVFREPKDGFRITGHKFEVYGVCRECTY